MHSHTVLCRRWLPCCPALVTGPPLPSPNKTGFAVLFFALELDKAPDRCWQCCHLCSSLRKAPSTLVEQSNCDPPNGFGVSFAADVIRRYHQLELVRDFLLVGWRASWIHSLRAPLTVPWGASLVWSPSVIRVDPAPGLATLYGDEIRRKYGNWASQKNPVAEKCVTKLGDELPCICPEGGTITPLLSS